jgi:TPP-dependent trihydroxycyclohexane-1,2-dione (THcHDO) dehydratase
MGTLIPTGEAERVRQSIAAAAASGALVLTSGDRDGIMVSATVVADVEPSSPFAQHTLGRGRDDGTENGHPARPALVSKGVRFMGTTSRGVTDFATASQSLFSNPDVRFASIDVEVHDAGRLGATAIVADAKRALAPLTRAVADSGIKSQDEWRRRVRARNDQWLAERAEGRLPVTVVVSENHGYQAIHGLQMWRSGREFGNEFRYRAEYEAGLASQRWFG